ncbi:hypothetical protein [Bifidobacterium simiiventris]|uniref:hypothetical protein n=1 Tax=Bifidobacterium simiiventris TaxID=2834434 RepID=UPI001C56CDA7|nr:hypothetical protein [Bifidobacterium simiiventris]MBW3079015.1 hypothetical protein [Bifidobacterium simiiventris]
MIQGKQAPIFIVLATVVVDIIMLLIPHTNAVAFWIALALLTLSGLLFLVPFTVGSPSDYTTRIPVIAALGVNYVAQIVLTFIANTGAWRVTVGIALVLFLVLAAVALATSRSEQASDESAARLAQQEETRFTPTKGGF